MLKLRSIYGAFTALVALAAVGCSNSPDAPNPGFTVPGVGGMDGVGGAGAGGMDGVGGLGAGGDIVDDPPPPEGCASVPKLMPRRVVRLTNAQLQNTIEKTVLGPPALEGITRQDPREREFQALRVEGDLINTELLRTTVGLASSAAASILPRYTEVTGCAAGDDACARGFLSNLAEQAYRRPLTADESAALTALYDSNVALFSTSPTLGVEEGVRYAVEAILAAPSTVYRTELGAPVGGELSVPLTGTELASAVSYFLTDGPPDPMLLAAGNSGQLATKEGLRAEVARVLQTPEAQQNLWQIMIAYYELKTIDSTIKDSAVFPDFTVGLRNSMYQESALFIQDVVQNGTVDDLLLSSTSFVNENLAQLYGLDIIATPDEFQRVDLPPEQRKGLLTHGSILAMRARTTDTSVVSRGLFVNSNILCNTRPPAPSGEILAAAEVQLSNGDLTERDRADERKVTSPCNGCHGTFDTFGVVLESYDSLGRYRTDYPNGTPIDTTGNLPATIGSGEIASVGELVTAATETGTFSRCVLSNVMKYALSDALGLLDRQDCGVQLAHEAFLASNQTFADLVTEVIVSDTLSQREVETP